MSDHEFSPNRNSIRMRTYDEVLRNAINNKEKIVKGLKETLKAIETRRAKYVFIAMDAPLENYKTVIKQYCLIFNDNESKNFIFEVDEWIKLRNVAFSYYGAQETKQNPKCYCAAILYPSKEEEKERKMKFMSETGSPLKSLKRQGHLFKKMLGFTMNKDNNTEK
jgi:hypothetical protein